MNTTMRHSLVLDKEYLVSLVADAYSLGLVAGQNACEVKDDPDFGMRAVDLFTSGFSAMLSESANRLEA